MNYKETISKDGHEKIVMQMPKDLDQKERMLIKTITGEPFMPARLYFKFLNKKTLIKALERRHCIDWCDKNTFNISYWEEAQTVKLDVPYDEVPENFFPVLLARGHFVSPSELYVDVRSFDRAIGILKFLNKSIGKKFMYATHIATYNRFMGGQGEGAEDILKIDYNDIFCEEKLQQAEPKINFSKLPNPENCDDDEDLKKPWEGITKQQIPVVRKVTVKNTSVGLVQLRFSLTINMVCAKEYWEGNDDFNPLDAISLLFKENEAGETSEIQE